jgi:hypothetical protein
MTMNVYECGECGERTTERRCPDCNLFTRRLGPGGHCPACDELITTLEITKDDQEPSLTYTENLTSSRGHALFAQERQLAPVFTAMQSAALTNS